MPTETENQGSQGGERREGDYSGQSRRSFLGRILTLWAGLTSLPFVYGIARFIYPPTIDSQIVETALVAQVEDIERDAAKIVRFNRQPVIVVRTRQDQYKAFSARCTHLGCVVEYRSDKGGYFFCNCHGSVFDLNGKNIQGPAPRPLDPLKVRIRDTNIEITAPRT